MSTPNRNGSISLSSPPASRHADFAYRGLGYVGLADPHPEQWIDFGTKICGLMPAQSFPRGGSPFFAKSPERNGIAEDGTAYLKMDDRLWRLAIHPDLNPGLRYLGFELASIPDWHRAVEVIRARGGRVREATDVELDRRSVGALAVLEDPAGHRIELFASPVRDRDFVSPEGTEFLSGDFGMGHAVLYVPDIEEALRFYRDLLGFQRSDFMTFGPDGMGIHFLRCTPRHHSIALLQVGDLSGLQHLMFETTRLDDVGKALDRAMAGEVPITSSLGRHRNDENVSFYMSGPSGFDVEFGWGGRLIDDDWTENEFAGGGDTWGHHGLDAASLEPKGKE